MTPEQAKAIFEAMSPETQQAFKDFIESVCEHVTRIDRSLERAGQRMADDAEDWLRETTK